MTVDLRERLPGIVDQLRFGDGNWNGASQPARTLKPGCAVVVCTRHRPALLSRFLDSLADQSPRPDQLVIVDSSDDGDSRLVLERHPRRNELAGCIEYRRVDASLAGVTRQRNLGLSLVETDLAAFFDDDIVLRPGCLAALERAHRTDSSLVGVGAHIQNEPAVPSLIWRLRRLLFIVPTLAPGRYFGSGVSTPWGFLGPTDALVEGDWLPGGAVMWKTAAARATGFAAGLDGYGMGNDLEFSLRIARFGRQAVAGDARLIHLQEGSGRPDPRRLGYESLRNRRYIHRIGGGDRAAPRLWFAWAVAVETGLQALNLLRPGRTRYTWDYLRGVGRFLGETLRGDAQEAAGGMVGQATAAAERAPRRWLQRAWGLPYIHARQDWSVVWPTLAALPREGIRVLDAGCGRGRWALELAARRPHWRIVGLDRDAAALRIAEAARRRLGLENLSFVQGNFADFRSPPAFDVVLSVCSAHYLAAAGGGDALFQCFAAALKPHGRLVLYAPRAAGEAPWLTSLPRPVWHDVFTAAQLRALCSATGLRIERLDGRLGRAGTAVKQIDVLAAGRWRRLALAAGLYGVECALAAWDRRTPPGSATLMWLLEARRQPRAADQGVRSPEPDAVMEAV